VKKELISLVAILTVLLSGCAMSPTSATDPNRDPARTQSDRPGQKAAATDRLLPSASQAAGLKAPG
jgi:PBP1b-binding outer membrane lipoprotein LpoB